MRQYVNQEIKIQRGLNHDNIARVFDVCEHNDGDSIHLVMELCEGGDLYRYVKKKGYLPERRCRLLFRQLISAVEYCHGNFVAHRDIKLENIGLDGSHRKLKLLDFGLSETMRPGVPFAVGCGSSQYIAPEVIEDAGYVGPPSDIWSMGVVLYAMLFGSLPFGRFGNDRMQVLKAARASDFYIDTTVVSPACAELVYRLLEPDCVKRINMTELREHAWVCGNGELLPPACGLCVCTPTATIDPDILTKLCYFGFHPVVTVEKLKLGVHCQETAMYNLLLKKKLCLQLKEAVCI